MFKDFDALSKEKWQEKILKELKGKPLDYVNWKNENFDIEPFYRGAELSDEKRWMDYLRTGLKSGWEIQQSFDTTNSKTANDLILEALENNCSSLHLKGKIEDLSSSLRGVLPELIHIYIPKNSLEKFVEWVGEADVPFIQIKGGIENSPLSNMLLTGELADGWESMILKDLKLTNSSSQFKILKIDGSIFENAGASIVQQLTYTISQGHEYLNSFEKKISIDDLSALLYFEMNIGPSYFLEIAKFRALRILWAKVIKAFGPKHHCSVHTYIVSKTSKNMLGITDHESNLIRNTTAALSAVLGTCNEVRVETYDGEENSHSQRLSRNLQNLLKEESYLDKVIDPAGGSYYIEEITRSLVKHAWEEFMKLEMSGGYLANVRNGNIQDNIKELAIKKSSKLNDGDTRIGVNKYLIPSEKRSFKWFVESNTKRELQLLPTIKCETHV